MQIPWSLHPFEMARTLRIFLKEFREDLDLRYPEGRKRRHLELHVAHGESFQLRDADLIDFIRAHRKFSLLDWPLLCEWNERWQLEKLRAEISEIIQDSNLRQKSGTSRTLRGILQRLSEIESQLKQTQLSSRPTLIELVSFRWRWGALRDEAQYLLHRSHHIS